MFVFLGVTAISNRLIISELKLRPLAAAVCRLRAVGNATRGSRLD